MARSYKPSPGRKSLKDETLYIKAVTEALFKTTNVDELQARINSRRYSVFDMMTWRALQEDGEKDRMFLAQRVIPERLPEDKEGNAQAVKIYLPKQDA